MLKHLVMVALLIPIATLLFFGVLHDHIVVLVSWVRSTSAYFGAGFIVITLAFVYTLWAYAQELKDPDSGKSRWTFFYGLGCTILSTLLCELAYAKKLMSGYTADDAFPQALGLVGVFAIMLVFFALLVWRVNQPPKTKMQ